MKQIETLSRIEEIIDLQDDWESLRESCRGSIFTSFEWSITWLECFKHFAAPHITVLRENGQIKIILPFVASKIRVMNMSLDKLWLIGNQRSAIELYDLDVLRRVSDEKTAIETVGMIDELDWHLLELANMRNTVFSRSLCQLLPSKWKTNDILTTPCPFTRIYLADDPIELIGKRTRRAIRKMMSILKNENRMQFEIAESPDQIKESINTYIKLHRKRWEKKGGSIFSDEHAADFLLRISMKMAAAGSGVCYNLIIDDEVAAQLLCFDDRACVRAYRVGVNDEYLDYSPGNIVTYLAMKDLKLKGKKYLDFAKGAEEFKYRMGAEDRYLLSVHGMRGGLATLSKLANLPLIRALVQKTKIKDSVLKEIYR
ncbi:MAG: GNAT family N-acetyltransferase [Methanomassiliicoccales archaeon]|jgi:CelD/BcsL family acetyltransferase involved in cellulose biosynthesis|nr:GNAT family N-acetyltransferase [Methanomassiliicoccales archaeon]